MSWSVREISRQNQSIAFYVGLRAPWHWLMLYLYLYAMTCSHVKHIFDGQLQGYSNTLQQHCSTLPQHCNALQRNAAHTHIWVSIAFCAGSRAWLSRAITRCNALQHTVTLCNTLQHTHTGDCQLHSVRARGHYDCHALPHAVTHCNALQRCATHCKTPHTHKWLSIASYAGLRVPRLWRTASHFNTHTQVVINCILCGLAGTMTVAAAKAVFSSLSQVVRRITYMIESLHIRERVTSHTCTKTHGAREPA